MKIVLLKYSFGLYQGNKIREKLKAEYLRGIQQIVLGTISAKYGAILTTRKSQ